MIGLENTDELLSWNVRGIRNINTNQGKQKVNKIKHELENVNQLKILCLQETHLRNECEIPKEWNKYKHLYHTLSTNATQNDSYAGIILFVNKTENILYHEVLFEGRILYTKIENKVTKEIKNIFAFYGKTKGKKDEKKHLIQLIMDKVEQGSLSNVFYLGDFNFVTSTLDRNGNKLNPVDNEYKDTMLKLETKIQIIDSYRHTNPNRRQYTFTATDKKSRSRIDRIYVPIDVIGKIRSTTFETSDLSDHKIVRLKMWKNIYKGPGQWVFNNSTLKEKDFTEEINKIIDDFEENIGTFPDDNIHWDFLKMNMASHAQNYSQIRARKNREKLQDIQRRLEILESIPKEHIRNPILNQIKDLKELEMEINKEKVKGTLLR